MGPFTRVYSLNRIPVLDAQGLPQDHFQVSGRMVLPLTLEKPVAGGGPPHRFFLSLALGQLVYLHESASVT